MDIKGMATVTFRAGQTDEHPGGRRMLALYNELKTPVRDVHAAVLRYMKGMDHKAQGIVFCTEGQYEEALRTFPVTEGR